MNDDLKEKIRGMIPQEAIDEYGDPFDDSDPRNTLASKRLDKFPDLSIQDQINLLAGDIDLLTKTMSALYLDLLQRKAGHVFDITGGNITSSGGYL